MAYQMAQMPVTLNNLEGHFSYLALFNSLFWEIWHVLSWCKRIQRIRGLWPWMSLKVIHQFQGFSNESRLHLCSAAITRFQLARRRRAVTQRQLGFLYCRAQELRSLVDEFNDGVADKHCVLLVHFLWHCSNHYASTFTHNLTINVISNQSTTAA